MYLSAADALGRLIQKLSSLIEAMTACHRTMRTQPRQSRFHVWRARGPRDTRDACLPKEHSQPHLQVKDIETHILKNWSALGAVIDDREKFAAQVNRAVRSLWLSGLGLAPDDSRATFADYKKQMDDIVRQIRVVQRAAVRQCASDLGNSSSAYRPATWFPKGMAARLRQAASPRRKTKRVRAKVIGGVKCYHVGDARQWWPKDVPKDA